MSPGSLSRVSASAQGKGGILTSVGWQVTLCDSIWHVSSVAVWQTWLRTAIHLLYFLLFEDTVKLLLQHISLSNSQDLNQVDYLNLSWFGLDAWGNRIQHICNSVTDGDMTQSSVEHCLWIQWPLMSTAVCLCRGKRLWLWTLTASLFRSADTTGSFQSNSHLWERKIVWSLEC